MVELDDSETDNYYAWLMAFGWLRLSLSGQLMLMDKKEEENLRRCIALAKSQYPDNFESE